MVTNILKVTLLLSDLSESHFYPQLNHPEQIQGALIIIIRIFASKMSVPQ